MLLSDKEACLVYNVHELCRVQAMFYVSHVSSRLCVLVHLLVLRKRGKLIMSLRAFFSSRPARTQLKRSGIVKERVFGCDLGEHLLNSGHDGNSDVMFLSFALV